MLDELLGRINVPEEEVIAHLAGLSATEKSVVLVMEAYRSKVTSALNRGEMTRAVDALDAPLAGWVDWMLPADTTYPLVRDRIQRAGSAERAALLADHDRLVTLRDGLSGHDFAKCLELLGRRAPDRATLLADPAVQEQIEAAWKRSNPGVRKIPVQGPPIHEEGGMIFLDLVTNELSFQLRVGGPSSTSDRLPWPGPGAIVVGVFHTHPQLGPDFEQGPSPQDIKRGAAIGVPGIIRTEVNGEATFYSYGPDVRVHLAGANFPTWSYPGPDGGEAP